MTTPTRVNTKKADRRDLKLSDFAALRAELERIEAAHTSGSLSTTGNWSPGRNLAHISDWIGYYLEGKFPFKVPLPFRLIGPLLKGRFIKKGFGAGLPMMRPDGVSDEAFECQFDEGLARLRANLDRIDAGASMAHKNPFLGSLSHEDAVKILLHHAEHHLGFLQYPGYSSPA